MPRKIDLHGCTFGRLTVVRPSTTVTRVTRWECICDCGSTVIIATDSLRQGNTKSCGCQKKELARERMCKTMTTHGATGTHVYRIWSQMWQRCTNPNNKKYALYGGRGIAVCTAWEEFGAFAYDMGPRPSPAHTLDRIDSNGNYEPGNVRWATQTEQQNNRRNNRVLVVNGESVTLAELGRMCGMKPALIGQRIDRDGLSVEEAVSKRVVRNGKTGFEVYDVVV